MSSSGTGRAARSARLGNKKAVGERGRKADGLSRAEVKSRFLEHIHAGCTIDQALGLVDRRRSTYEGWRKQDPDFVLQMDRIRKLHTAGAHERTHMPFTEFSEKYLGAQVFPHTQNVVDMIEGNEPSWLHPSMDYEAGEPDLVMVNMPPEHGKSAAITINYVTYRIAMDPNIRVIIVSKTQTMARKFLYAIKTRLTHPKFTDMHVAYGPQGGYDSNSESWSADRIYISADSRDSGEKDPTVEALGIGSHIYGARADLIVVDDAVDTSNAHQYDKHIDWLQGEVMSRIAATGSMLIVGTRLASRDMYLELREPMRYPDEASPWSYLSMPAVLEFSEKPKDWVTLWPRSNMPEAGDRYAIPDEDGLYPKWDGPRLAKKRNRVSPRAWALIYQQQQVSEDMIFTPEMVRGCVNSQRNAGRIREGFPGNRKGGMSGLVVVAGLDPATTGTTAAVVAGLDPVTHKRYVLDMHNQAGLKPEQLKELVMELTDKYGIIEWRIEQNAFQGFLVYDQQLNNDLATRGCVIRPHQTGSNKHDAEFGVAAMAGLMTGHENGSNLIEFPSLSYGEAPREMINQLLTWSPQATAKKNHHYDLVMALWFTMLACQDRDSWGRRSSHATGNPFLSPRGEREQSVVNIDEYLADMEREQFQYEPIGF